MEFSLIMILILFLVGIYFIFKLIKKVIFTIVSVIFLILAVVGAVFGLVYIDFQQLAMQEDFEINTIYVNSGKYDFGTKILIQNNSKLDLNSFKGISRTQLDNIKVNEITKDDNLFVVEIDDTIFSKLIAGKTFNFKQFASNDAFSSFKVELTGSQITNLLNSNTAKDDFINLVLKNNNIKGKIETVVKPLVTDEINSLPFEIKEILFLFTLQESIKDKENILTLIKAYQNDSGVSVYPDRFTFKLIRYLPVSTIESYIPKMPSLTPSISLTQNWNIF